MAEKVYKINIFFYLVLTNTIEYSIVFIRGKHENKLGWKG